MVVETVCAEKLRNTDDACRLDAGAATDMTQIASGAFSDETSYIMYHLLSRCFNDVLIEMHSACQ